jgi:8-hydroxy-5-deazaflavin:NADPH oxidoreductase
MKIALLGGTGPEGLGLAARFLAAGETVAIGSRTLGRAEEAAGKLRALVPAGRVTAATNADAAAASEVIAVSVPFAGLDATLAACGAALEGKVILDLVVPLRVEGGIFLLEEVVEGSAAERIQARVPGARVVSGLKHQSAADLLEIGTELEGDVLLCGDDAGAKEIVSKLVRDVPKLRPIDAGGLRIARHLDAVTALLLNLNKRHKARSSVRLVGI